MTQKQVATRLGVDAKQLDYEFSRECRGCSRTGGKNEPCKYCLPELLVTVKEKEK